MVENNKKSKTKNQKSPRNASAC